MPRLGASFVLLGTGERRYEDLWRGLAARHPDAIGARIGFDEGLAHLIEGGADMFLMPSRFEPCGLNQMYSLRYGTVPVVRATGGCSTRCAISIRETGEGTGFTFDEYSPQALLGTLRWALELSTNDRASGGGFSGPACGRIFRGTRRRASTSRCMSGGAANRAAA